MICFIMWSIDRRMFILIFPVFVLLWSSSILFGSFFFFLRSCDVYLSSFVISEGPFPWHHVRSFFSIMHQVCKRNNLVLCYPSGLTLLVLFVIFFSDLDLMLITCFPTLTHLINSDYHEWLANLSLNPRPVLL